MPVMSVVERSFCRSAPWRSFANRVVLPRALRGVEPTGRLLEIGAGSGSMAEAIARRWPELDVVATDVDPVMVESARQRLAACPNATAWPADTTALPFDDAEFDVVASFLMLHHVVDWTAALSEAARVLRPGGTFVGYDLDRTRFATLIHWADRSPYRLIAHDELAPALRSAGLTVVDIGRGLASHVVAFRARKPVP